MTDGSWWDAFGNAGGLDDLETWLGGVDAYSRTRVRERIAECHYESVLDCGAGLGIDWLGFPNFSHSVSYQGIEASEVMRRTSEIHSQRYGRGAPPIIEGNIESIPFEDESFDLVYCRHVLEHLPRFELGLAEMIRVARLEAIAIFFIRPGAETYLFRERDGLWQNRYAKHEIEAFLQREPRAEVWFWEHRASEVMLHVLTPNTLAVDTEQVAARVKHDIAPDDQ